MKTVLLAVGGLVAFAALIVGIMVAAGLLTV